jgi:phosphoenolpyruvate-protein kinase (PTS system EI component)
MKHRLSLSGEAFPSLPTEFDAVGLVRPEFLLRSVGQHITREDGQRVVADYMHRLVADAGSLPIWYRCSDLWSDEAATLDGIDEVLVEENPIIGVRGLRRLLQYPRAFEMEIQTVRTAIRDAPNVHLIFPFVMDGEQFAKASEMVRDFGWTNRIGAMVEIPSAAILCSELVAAGASNLMIGLNDLSSLTLGVSRDPQAKTHPVVWDLIGQVGAACGDVEWGVAGSMTADVYRHAAASGVPYVTLHYAELPDLLGTDAQLLPDRGFVAQVKADTRRRFAAVRKSAS